MPSNTLWSFFLVFVLAIVASADTRTYLVYRADNFPQDRYLTSISPLEYKRFMDTGKKDLDKANGQPFRLTRYEINYSGKYAIWGVSYDGSDELRSMESMERQGYIALISSCSLLSTYSPILGGVQDSLECVNTGAIPEDFYEVGVSST